MTEHYSAEIALHILQGFEDYREHFRAITDGAPQRFARGQWQLAQQASAQRIELYESKVAQTCQQLSAQGSLQVPLLKAWPAVKEAYTRNIEQRLDDELAQTWFNSIFCNLFGHAHISDQLMFVYATRSATKPSRFAQTRRYRPQGDLKACLEQIFTDYSFACAYEDLARDLEHLHAQLKNSLPDWVVKDPALELELLNAALYRNKGAYLLGRLYSPDEQWPLVFALINQEGRGLVLDAAITDEAQVSIIFSFTRSYFMVDVEVPAAFVGFLKQILPGKHIAELYSSIGFYKHAKSEFYRSLLSHLGGSDDRFVMAPGVRGMVMSVFTLPGFNTVFKVIKDRFAHAKTVDRATVIAKYRMVKQVDRVGRMADTQEFSDFRFAKDKFDPACLAELLEVAPSTVILEGETVLVRHCWTERRMIPLNLYLESATAEQVREALDDYGLAIKQLAAANIFPGDMLLKNFGVTRHARVVFYDYDEICLLSQVNFRKIPPARYPEDELSAEPWYSVGPMDVFPEEFPRFLFADVRLRRLFNQLHGELFDAAFWQSLQAAIAQGKVIDVFPYRRQNLLA